MLHRWSWSLMIDAGMIISDSKLDHTGRFEFTMVHFFHTFLKEVMTKMRMKEEVEVERHYAEVGAAPTMSIDD